MSPPTTSLTKFIINNKFIYIKVLWKNEDNLFEMHLFDGDHVWTGAFHQDAAEKIRKKYDNPENYSDDVKNCLNGEDQSFSFKFEPENTIAKFSLTKKFEGVTQVMGTVTLHQDDSVNKLSFIDFLLDENTELKNTVTMLEQSNDIVNKELTKCKRKIENYVDSKIALESILYGKFVQLLNAKKRRIQLLEDNIKNFENSHDLST